MPIRYSLNQINLIKNRNVFFDANVLIYIFWPTGSYKWEEEYSKAFGSLLKQHNNFYTHFLIISEVINRIYRIEYKKHLHKENLKEEQFTFKDYRNSIEGTKTLEDIYSIIKDVLSNFLVIEKSFNKIEIENFLIVETIDFIDKAILKICLENNFILFTNDKDYKNFNVDILSSNPAFFNY